MSTQRHTVKCQVLELNLPDTEGAYTLQETISRICRTRLPHLIELHCNAFSALDRVDRFDRLELDLGTIDPAHLEEEVVNRFSRLFPKALKREVLKREPVEKTPDPPKPGSPMELLAFFTRNGTLPWWADPSQPRVLEKALETLIERSPEGLRHLMGALAREERPLRRIVSHFKQALLLKLMRSLLPKPEEAWADLPLEILKAIRTSVTSPGRPLTDLQPVVWFAALFTLAHGAYGADRVPRSVKSPGAVSPEAFQPVAFCREILMQTAPKLNLSYRDLIRVISQNRAGMTPRLAVVVQILYAETTPKGMRSTLELETATMSKSAPDVDPFRMQDPGLSTQDGAKKDANASEERNINEPETDAMSQSAIGVDPSRIQDPGLLTQDGAKKDANASEKMNINEPETDAMSQSAIGVDPSRIQDPGLLTQDGAKKDANASEKMNINEPETDAMSQSAIGVDPSRIQDPSFLTPMLPKKVKENGRYARLKGREGRFSTFSPIPRSGKDADPIEKNLRADPSESALAVHCRDTSIPPALGSLERSDAASEREPAVDMRFSDADEVYVGNAGLVLLAPYLTRFFQRLDLVEKTLFKDPVSVQRAAGLLAYLASGDPAPVEYDLPLGKMLCGLELTEVFDFGEPVSESEAEECTGLLEALISNAPMLGRLSVSGFQGSFLLRKGILAAGAGAWLLRVERATYDVVLDRLPWSFHYLKLPWMEMPVRVEW